MEKKIKKLFTVDLKRTFVERVAIEVEAFDSDEAFELAEKRLEGDEEFDWDFSDEEVIVDDVYPST